MSEDFIKAMSGMNLEGAEGFMPLMQGMMKNLLAKEVLYPNLKDLYEKVMFSIKTWSEQPVFSILNLQLVCM